MNGTLVPGTGRARPALAYDQGHDTDIGVRRILYMKAPTILAFAILLAATAAAAAPPGAGDPRGQPGMTPEQAGHQAKRHFGGRVLNVKPLPKDHPGAPGYRVRLLDHGEVRTVTVPSRGHGERKGARPRR